MAERLDFDTQIQGLMNYRQALGAISFGHELAVGSGEQAISTEAAPQIGNTIGPLGLDLMHADLARAIRKAQQTIDENMRWQASYEYGHSNNPASLHNRDIRTDNIVQSAVRADLLAVMTAPRDQETRKGRARIFQTLLGRLAAGDRVIVPKITVKLPLHGSETVSEEQIAEANPSLPLYGVLGVRDTLYVQQTGPKLECVTDSILHLDLEHMFWDSETIDIVYQDRAAA